MSDDGSEAIGEFLQGEHEPASSWVVLAFGLVTALVLLVLHSILYPGRELPVIAEILPVFEGVFDSGIWFFILGVMLGGVRDNRHHADGGHQRVRDSHG